MVNFHDLAADLHIGYKVAIGIVFGALLAWVGWSVVKYFANMFGSTKKQKIEA
jgi:hypothetical protein